MSLTRKLINDPLKLNRSLFLNCTRRLSSETRVWEGLSAWRAADVDLRRQWRDGASAIGNVSDVTSHTLPESVISCGEMVLQTADPVMKAEITHCAYKALKCESISVWILTYADREGRVSMEGRGKAPEWPAMAGSTSLISAVAVDRRRPGG